MQLNETKIILASGSPRRIKMLEDEGAKFAIIKPDCEENINTALSPRQTVMALALRKALNVWDRLTQAEKTTDGFDENASQADTLIIACDTVVEHKGKIIGKPRDEEDAFKILSELNGDVNRVWSGVCLKTLHKNTKITLVFSCVTDVYFRCYSDDDIREYIKSGEPMDKAGAYAIQGLFGKYIDHIDGDYDNVVGFPLGEIKRRLLSI